VVYGRAPLASKKSDSKSIGTFRRWDMTSAADEQNEIGKATCARYVGDDDNGE